MRLSTGDRVRIGLAVAGTAGLLATSACFLFGIPWLAAVTAVVVAFSSRLSNGLPGGFRGWVAGGLHRHAARRAMGGALELPSAKTVAATITSWRFALETFAYEDEPSAARRRARARPAP